MKYLEETQFSNADNISSLTPMLPKENLVLDQSTQANLELADKGQATLFWVLNRCRTPMGRRALKEWITSPLQDLDEISRRQDMIETLAGDGRLRAGLAELLSRCRDMGKSLSRLTLKMGLPYDVQSVGVTLGVVPEIVSLVSGYPALARIVPQCDTSELAALLRAAVAGQRPALCARRRRSSEAASTRSSTNGATRRRTRQSGSRDSRNRSANAPE